MDVPLVCSCCRTINGWAVLLFAVVVSHVLESSLKAMTGETAGEKCSECTILLDRRKKFTAEILLAFIILIRGTGFQCFRDMGAKGPVLDNRLTLALQISLHGSIVAQKFFRFMLREKPMEQQ